jgi:GrpB-like predicted nucleotidyltransferase (UPF0157 family)
MRLPHRIARLAAATLRHRMGRKPRILPYSVSRTAYIDYDPHAVDVAREVGDLLEDAAPGVKVEHIGSTAIPGCAGKGIVDLMALYPPGQLGVTREALDKLGFQRQKAGHIFPEERPMRVGAIDYDGRRYRLHVHVIAENSPEVASLRRFRDVLRRDPSLANDYQARKIAILEAGVSRPEDYTHAKGKFIEAVIGSH